MSEGAYWKLYSPLRDQEIAKVRQMASLMMVEMLGKVWLEQFMRGQCLSLRTDLQNMEETRAGLGCRWRLRPVCASLLLPAGPSYLLVLVLSTWSMERPFRFSLAIPLSGPITREGHAPSARTLPNTFFCASWPLREQDPWERNPERNSSFKKYRTKLFQVSIFETNLFVMMVCLCTDSLDFQQPSNPHVSSISCCWVSSVLCSNSVLFRSSPSGNSRLTQGCL